jgi:hypothetical protein
MLDFTGSGGLARSQLPSLWLKDHPGQRSLPIHALEISKVPRATLHCFLDACADIVQTRHVRTAPPPPSSSASVCFAGSGGLHIFARGLPGPVNLDGRQTCNELECKERSTALQAVQGKKLEPVQAEKLDNPATYYCLECLRKKVEW